MSGNQNSGLNPDLLGVGRYNLYGCPCCDTIYYTDKPYFRSRWSKGGEGHNQVKKAMLIQCLECKFKLYARDGETLEELVKRWNERYLME